MSKRVQITTYVAEEVAEELEEIAAKQQRSLAGLLRLALFELLDRERMAKEAAA